MPRYDYACAACESVFEATRPVAEAGLPAPCPVCGGESPRVIGSPRFLFTADPRDTRPVWHDHDGYRHAHAPRRGRHRTPGEEH